MPVRSFRVQTESGLPGRGEPDLPPAHHSARLEAHLRRRLVPAQGGVAAGVPGGAGSALHLVLQQGALPALVARVHQGAHGVRQAARLPRRHHMQPEPTAATAYEEDRHFQRGQVAGTVREELANHARRPGGAPPATGGR